MKLELIEWRRRMGRCAALFFFGGALALAGCGSAPCETTKTCPVSATGGGGGGGASSTASSMGGSAGGVPAGCVPKDEFDATKGSVSDDCGIFVSESMGDDAGDGSKAKPYANFKAAGLAAEESGKPIYACAETFTGGVRGHGSLKFFGGLDCANDWVWQADTKTRIEDSGEGGVFQIDGDGTARVADVVVVASDSQTPGASSIAMLVNAATVTIERSELIAGKGAKGDDGAQGGGTAEKGANGADGEWVMDKVCANASTMGYFGGLGASGASCASGGTSNAGGRGGSGEPSQTLGGTGIDGEVKNAGGGSGGKAQDSNSSCNAGGKGDNGMAGAAGEGASGQGTLSANGYQGVSGTDGVAGSHGHGGGGGGGAKECAPTSSRSGPSGGGGGSGGCGGTGGKGGKAGGSSIGLVSIDATLTFDGLVVTAVDGGAGGDGADGQGGGMGGFGGINPAVGSCDGGEGGKGGLGGPGGGGLGGHSIGVAYVGSAPTSSATVTIGKGAAGGQGNGNAGAVGQAVQTLEFSSK